MIRSRQIGLQQHAAVIDPRNPCVEFHQQLMGYLPPEQISHMALYLAWEYVRKCEDYDFLNSQAIHKQSGLANRSKGSHNFALECRRHALSTLFDFHASEWDFKNRINLEHIEQEFNVALGVADCEFRRQLAVERKDYCIFDVRPLLTMIEKRNPYADKVEKFFFERVEKVDPRV